VLAQEQRFTPRGPKRRGVTDTIDGKEAKKAASGHKTDQMINRHDHEVTVADRLG